MKLAIYVEIKHHVAETQSDAYVVNVSPMILILNVCYVDTNDIFEGKCERCFYSLL